MSTLKVVSVFCGAGLFDEGIALAKGFEVIAAYDKWPLAVRTYNANGVGRATVWDLNGRLPKYERGSFDLLMGSPPCQSFSTAGKGKGINDPNGQLVLRYVDMLKETQPNIGFVFENVAGLKERHPQVLAALMHEFEEAGYPATEAILNAKDFGVPQDRRRLFIVGFRKSSGIRPIDLSKCCERSKVVFTLGDALCDVPARISEKSPADFPQHDNQPRNNYPYYPSLKTKRRDYRRRLDPKGPAPTIVTDHYNNMLHPLVDRHLTVRELAILQGVRNDFVFCGTAPKDNAKMIANGVPPRLAAAVMMAVRRHIKKTNK